MGFFDRQNLKSIQKMLQASQPNVGVSQIPSEYRDDGRDILRASIQGMFYLDLVEDDHEWDAVVALMADGTWNPPGERTTIPLGVKVWAKLEDVAEAYSREVSDALEIAARYYSMTETELDEFFIAEENRVDLSSREIVIQDGTNFKAPESTRPGASGAAPEVPARQKGFKWVWVVIALIIALLIFGGCGSGGWQMGRDGDGYRVQCVDGAWSNSGGKSGACSWHGGVR